MGSRQQENVVLRQKPQMEISPSWAESLKMSANPKIRLKI